MPERGRSTINGNNANNSTRTSSISPLPLRRQSYLSLSPPSSSPVAGRSPSTPNGDYREDEEGARGEGRGNSPSSTSGIRGSRRISFRFQTASPSPGPSSSPPSPLLAEPEKRRGGAEAAPATAVPAAVELQPDFLKSYDARKIGFQIAKNYVRLYTPQERERLDEAYEGLLKKHGRDPVVQWLHQEIVLDVLESSSTPYLTILLNGFCPPILRRFLLYLLFPFGYLFSLCCCLPRSLRPSFSSLRRNLTPSYWQANLDDEITFYTFQFIALSFFPLLPSLLSASLAILSSRSWTLVPQACSSSLPSSFSNFNSACPLDFYADMGGREEGREDGLVSHVFMQGNARDSKTGWYYTNPVRVDSAMGGRCSVSETVEGLPTMPQVRTKHKMGVACVCRTCPSEVSHR